MDKTGCRRETPAHGYTVWCDNGRSLAARLYPHAMGMVCGGGPEGVDLRQKWWRHREQRPPRHHPPPRLRTPRGHDAGMAAPRRALHPGPMLAQPEPAGDHG